MKRLLGALVILLIVFSAVGALADEWICPSCGKTNTTNFCTSCGTEQPTWLCPKCGEKNKDAFCGNCGFARSEALKKDESFVFNGMECKILSEESVTIVKGNFQEEKIIIPERINGYSVISIEPFAFQKHIFLKEIKLPEGLIKIGEGAFSNCSLLSQITIPNTVEVIGNGAFQRSGLEKILIPSNIRSIGDNAFSHCPKLMAVYFEDGISSMGNSVFYDCGKLISVRLPRTLISIPASMFNLCTCLSEVIIPEGIQSIGEKSFSSCISLNELFLPEGFLSIGVSAFWSCSNLRDVYIPQSAETISRSAFAQCDKINIHIIKSSKAYSSLLWDTTLFKDPLEDTKLWNRNKHDVLTGSFQFANTVQIDPVTFYFPKYYQELSSLSEVPRLSGIPDESLNIYKEFYAKEFGTSFLYYDKEYGDIIRVVISPLTGEDISNIDLEDPTMLVGFQYAMEDRVNSSKELSLKNNSMFVSYDFGYTGNDESEQPIIWFRTISHHNELNIDQASYIAISDKNMITVVFERKVIGAEDKNRYDDIIRLCNLGGENDNHRICGTTDFEKRIPDIDPETGKAIDYYETYETSYIDEKGLLRTVRKTRPVYIKNNTLADVNTLFKQTYKVENQLLSEGKVIVKQGELYGYSDYRGNILIPPRWLAATSFHNGRAAVQREDGKWLLIDEHGNQVSYSTIECSHVYLLGDIFRYSIYDREANKSRSGMLDLNGKIITEAVFDEIYYYTSQFSDDSSNVNGLFRTKIDEKYGLIGAAGEVILDVEYDDIEKVGIHLFRIKKNDDYTFFDVKSKQVIDIEFSIVKSANEGFLLFEASDGKKGYLDDDLHVTISPIFDEAEGFYEGVAKVGINGKFGCIDTLGNIIIPIEYDVINTCSEGYIFAKKDDKSFLLSSDGNIAFQFDGVVERAWNMSDGLMAVIINGQFCFYDESGNNVISAPYDGCTMDSFFNGTAIIRVKKDIEGDTKTLQGLINKSGEVVIEPIYDRILPVSENLLSIEKNKLYGLVNSEGEIILEPEYKYRNVSNDGYMLFIGNETWFIVDKGGKIVF